jgi:hypothetical protein
LGQASRCPIKQSRQGGLEPLFLQPLAVPWCMSRVDLCEQRCRAGKGTRLEELAAELLNGSG